MIAVIETGGKQYLVSPGEKIKIEKVEAEVGSNISFKEVLLIEDKKGSFSIGTPYLEKAEVVGEVVEEGRGDKKIIFKYKPKKRYKLKKGHRQQYTEVKITDIKTK
ncbi:MAG: 50S ribosomal protein L21 [Patescibacteria group bacterium]|nr:50S ribosomal protein L21 [Patescibacteria group bacterium]